MKFAYSRTELVPALVVPVVLAAPDGSGFVDIDGRIDTGADLSIIPEAFRITFKLTPANYVMGVGARGERWKSLATFMVRIRAANLNWFDVEVVTSTNNYVLIGRDILNRCLLVADGPAGFFEISSKAGTK